MAKVRLSQLGKAVSDRVIQRIRASRIEQVLVSQAKRRISNGGDSTHEYPPLWDHPLSYRRGGKPLRDTGLLMASLTARQQRIQGGVRLKLQSPLRHAQYHQNGFRVEGGPLFIPLTRKAVRGHTLGSNPSEEGLKKGTDYILIRRGVTVPQRKIANAPPENVRELAEELKRIIAED